MPSRVINRSITLVLLLFSLFLSVHCSYFFEEKKVQEEVTISELEGSCITISNKVVGAYFKSDAIIRVDGEALDYVIDCYEKSIASFSENTISGGEDPDSYNSKNLFNFLSKFYGDFEMSQERIESYLVLKSFLIGGERDSVTKKELKIISGLLPHARAALANLAPHRDIILRHANLERNEEGYDLFNKAFRVLKNELGGFIKRLDRYQTDKKYNLDDLMTFLFSEYYGQQFSEYEKYIPVIQAFKNLSINDVGRTISRDRFSFFVRQGLLAYEGMTQFSYFVVEEGEDKIFTNLGHIASFITQIPGQLHGSEIFKTVTLKSVADIINKTEVVLTYSMRSRKNQKIDIEVISQFLNSLQGAEVMGENLSAITLTRFLKRFSSKWLQPGGPRDPDLNIEKLHYIRRTIMTWFKRQHIINTLFADGGVTEVSLFPDDRLLPENKELDQWVSIFRKVRTHNWNAQRRMIYSRNIREMSYAEMTVSNSIRILAEVFMKPFNLEQKDPTQFKITESETQEIYLALRILGVEMAFMDSRVIETGRRTFMEANNFSLQKESADGFLDFYEAYEFLSVAVSSGELSEQIYDDMSEGPPCRRPYADVHHLPVTEKDCFVENLQDNFGNYFSQLPLLREYWGAPGLGVQGTASAQEKKDFLFSLEYASRAGSINNKPYDLGEIRIMVQSIYYLQAIFTLFDKNENGIAEGAEVRSAEERFRPMIVNFITEKRPDLFEGFSGGLIARFCDGNDKPHDLAECIAPKLFIFLLKEGSLPSGASSTAKFARFLISDSAVEKAYDKIQAGPGQVLKVFSALAIITKQGHLNRLYSFIENRREELMQSLSDSEEAPSCWDEDGDKPFKASTHVFCDWARELYCNESVNQEIYTYFRRSRYSLFDSDHFRNVEKVEEVSEHWDPMLKESIVHNKEKQLDAAVLDTLEKIYFKFTDELFSTQCAAPWPESLNDTAAATSVIDEEKLKSEEEVSEEPGFFGGLVNSVGGWLGGDTEEPVEKD